MGASCFERQTERGERTVFLFNYSVDCTPSLHILGDLNSGGFAGTGEEVPLTCNCVEGPCSNVQITLEQKQTTEDCIDWVFGVRWSLENFLKRAVMVGHPLKSFQAFCQRSNWLAKN